MHLEVGACNVQSFGSVRSRVEGCEVTHVPILTREKNSNPSSRFTFVPLDMDSRSVGLASWGAGKQELRDCSGLDIWLALLLDWDSHVDLSWSHESKTIFTSQLRQ